MNRQMKIIGNKHMFLAILFLAASVQLSGCGAKGELYLPRGGEQQQQK